MLIDVLIVLHLYDVLFGIFSFCFCPYRLGPVALSASERVMVIDDGCMTLGGWYLGRNV